MSNVVIDRNKIDLLANSISVKSGEQVPMTLDKMIESVDGLNTDGITPTGTILITENGNGINVTNLATVNVHVPDGSNMAISTFRTSSVGGTVQIINIPYTGSGYPIIGAITPTCGFFNNSDLYNLVKRYAFTEYSFVKHDFTVAPVYSSSSTSNQTDARVMYSYKSSSTSALLQASSGNSYGVYSDNTAQVASSTPLRFTSNTQMRIFIASDSYGFAPGIDYTYFIIYSS